MVGGEQPLKSQTCCNLGSLNLYEFVKNKFTSEAYFDMTEFSKAVSIASNALDDIIDENSERLPKALKEYKKNAKNWRNIGLGVFNYAYTLIALGMAYGSSEALHFTERLFACMSRIAFYSNISRGKEKGGYPKFKLELIKKSHYYNTLRTNSLVYISEDFKLRNCTMLSIAPTGSIATMLGGSGGIEPEFQFEYIRKTNNLNECYKIESKIVKDFRKVHLNEPLPDYFVSSKDIPWKDRINTQAVIQNYVDTAISSTVNLPNNTTLEENEQLYLYAWKKGLKGVTIYRNGCKRSGILTTTKEKENNKIIEENTPKRGEVLKIDDDKVIGLKKKLMSGCVDSETEFFNGKQWKKISNYEEGDLVLQYNLDGTANLVKPLNYIKRPSQGQYHIVTKYGLDMMLSPDHRNVTFIKDNKPKIMTTQEIINSHDNTKTGFTRKFKVCFNYNGPGIDLTDDEIRLSVAIFADGCFYSPTSKKCLISVKKKRKRERLINILNHANIEYSELIDNDGYYNIKFYPPLYKVKTFPEDWYNCSNHQLRIIFDEIFHWDGYDKRNNEYITIHKSNADFIQFVCAALGFQGSIYKDTRNQNITYRVDWSSRILRSFATQPKREIPFVMPKDGYDYCFSVPSTMLVLRRNDKIFVTGNCGSLHCAAYFDIETGDLKEIYLSKGSTGGCNNFMTGLSRMISMSARAGVKINDIVDQLMSTGACPSYVTRTKTKHDTSKGSCCPMAVGYALKEMWEEFQGKEMKPKEQKSETLSIASKEDTKLIAKCPECGEPLIFEGGCNICKSCGWSKCD